MNTPPSTPDLARCDGCGALAPKDGHCPECKHIVCNRCYALTCEHHKPAKQA